MKYKRFFKHFRTEKNGSVTVCAEFSNGPAFLMGVAFCSPNEKGFVKKVGRYISEGRLKGLLDHKKNTFGRGWNFIATEDRDKGNLMEMIEKFLPKVEGPQWYPGFLREWRKFKTTNVRK